VKRRVDYDPKAGAITFRDAAQSWLATRHDLKPTTLAGYRYALAPTDIRQGDGKTLGINAVFGGYPLNALKREHITAWVAALVKKGKRPSTIRHAVVSVKQVLEQAVVDGRIPHNPARAGKATGRARG
jgi:site-specific recombinase XerC